MNSPYIMSIEYYCPRCGTKDIFEYKKTFECAKCRDNAGMPLEFEKESIGKIPDKEILAIREMDSFTGAFEELRDSEKRKKFFDSLLDDDLES